MSATTRAIVGLVLVVASAVFIVAALILERGGHWHGSTTALWFALVAIQGDYWLSRGKR